MIKPSWVEQFFFICAGAKRHILDNCPTEWTKYAGIGATIFFTGLLASLSGGYALYTVFRGDPNAIEYAIGFGLIWGFLIFNLDRFIVGSIRKEGDILKELYQALPRIILALIISIVIAKPLEVKLFEDRIEQQILENSRDKLKEEKLDIDQLNDITKKETELTEAGIKLSELDSIKQGDPNTESFQKLIERKNQASQDLRDVSNRNNPKISQYNQKISQIRGDGQNYIEITDSLGVVIDRVLQDQAKREIRELNYSKSLLIQEIKTRDNDLSDINAEIQKDRNDFKAALSRQISDQESLIKTKQEDKRVADSIASTQLEESIAVKKNSYTNNFVTQLEAMGTLTEDNAALKWTSWMIMLLFIVVETAPIVVKLLSKRGPYDEILDREEYEIFIKEKEVISKWNTKINELVSKAQEAAKLEGEVYLKVEKQRLEYELQNNQAVLDDLAKKQEHLAKIAIDKWYEEELNKAIQPKSSTPVPPPPSSTPNLQTSQQTNIGQGAVSNRVQSTNQTSPPPSSGQNPALNPSQTPTQATNSAQPVELEGGSWKQLHTLDDIEFMFNIGQSGTNEFILSEKNNQTKGTWQTKENMKELSIVLPGTALDFEIIELKKDRLILKSKDTQQYLEFEKLFVK